MGVGGKTHTHVYIYITPMTYIFKITWTSPQNKKQVRLLSYFKVTLVYIIYYLYLFIYIYI